MDYKVNVVTREYIMLCEYRGSLVAFSRFAESEESAKLKLPADAKFVRFQKEK